MTPSRSTSIIHHFYPILLCLFVFFIPFIPDEKLVRSKLAATEISILLLCFIAVSHWLLTLDIKNIKKMFLVHPWKWFWLALGGWLLVNVFLTVLSRDPVLAQAELRRIILAAGTLLSFSLIQLDDVWIKRVFLSLCFSGTLLSLYAILQSTGGVGPIMVPHVNRVYATYGNPIFFAAFLIPILFLTVSLYFQATSTMEKFICLLSLAIQAWAFYLAQTRAAWIALVVCLVAGLIILRGLKKRTILILMVLMVIGLLFVLKTHTIWERDQGHLLIWRDTIKMWLDQPLTGVGLGAFHTTFPEFAGEDLINKWPKGKFVVNYAHNEFLQVIAEQGILGILALFFLLGTFIVGVKEKNNPIILGLFLGFLGLWIQNIFSVDMRFSISYASAFMLMGLTIGAQSKNQENPPAFHPINMGLILVWMGFLGLVIFPNLIKPYQANKEFQEQVSFFDERLLDPAKTIGDLKALHNQYPNEVPVLEKLAYAYAKEIRRPDGTINQEMSKEALKAYKGVIKLNPNHAGAYNNIGNILFTTGQKEKALDNWKTAVRIDPQLTDVQLNLGKILYTQGDLKQSAKYFENVLKIDPSNAEAQIYLKRMVE